MKQYIENRVKEVAKYTLQTESTIRKTAKAFGVSKSTIHNDLIQRLPQVNPQLAGEIKKVINRNTAERALRGGMATRMKYLSM